MEKSIIPQVIARQPLNGLIAITLFLVPSVLVFFLSKAIGLSDSESRAAFLGSILQLAIFFSLGNVTISRRKTDNPKAMFNLSQEEKDEN